MATKKNANANVMTIQGIKEKTITLHLEGDSPLILNKRARSYEREEIFRQSHKKGTKLPDNLDSKLHYNLWEKLITSITWEKPIQHHDDYEDYTEEEYDMLMSTNRPCILAKAFANSFAEAFKSLGFKEATGRDGTDLTRGLSISINAIPVNFAAYRYDVHLTPNNQRQKANVLSQYTMFEGWSCDLTVSFIESMFPEQTIIELINSTGKFMGIGTRRKESYGKYHVAEVAIH